MLLVISHKKLGPVSFLVTFDDYHYFEDGGFTVWGRGKNLIARAKGCATWEEYVEAKLHGLI